MRLGLGLGLSRGAGANSPLNLSAPAVSGTLTTGSTLTSTTGTWSGAPTGYTYQWKRDGANISGQTASAYTYAASTDDGRYISCAVTATNIFGSNSATSNVLITSESAVFYTTSFVGADNTAIVGYESWAGVGFNAATKAYIIGNDFNATVTLSGMQYTRVASTSDHEIEATTSYVATGANATNTRRELYARYTDANNYLQLYWQNSGWGLVRRVAGVNTTIQTLVTPNLVSGDVIKLRVSGNYAKVYRNGSETAESAAANSGLGYDVSAVPSIAKIALGAGDVSGLSLPYPVFTAATINNILADQIAISTIATENIGGVPGVQRVRLTGSVVGSVTQLQALVLSSTGQVLLDWADVSGLSGSSFDSVTGTLPQSAEGQTVTVWLRDKTNKDTATSSTVTVAVQAQVVPLTVGMNTVRIGTEGEVSGDLMRMAILYVKKNGAFRNVFAPNATVDPASVSYVDATDVGMDSNYFPTIFPSGGSYIGTDYPFYYFSGTTDGLAAALHGVYDVEFTPGMRWTLTSANGAMVRSNYNEAAGTATITCNGNTGAATEIKFDGYDNGGGYVARTLPSAGNGYFRVVKQGQAAGKVFQPIVATSLGELSSANGFTRFMGANNINKEALANVTYGTKTAPRPATAVGLVSQGESMSIIDMIEICTDTGTNPWVCIHDTADATYVADVATQLDSLMPTGMVAAIEYSNEMWNFGPAFGQSTSLQTRAAAAGVTNIVQYSREYKTKILDVFEAVFGVNSPRLHPVFCWQAVITESQLTSMLDEGSIYQKIKGFGIAPYVGGGIGTGADQGNYNTVSIFSKANRDLILTDVAAFKTAFFAATTVMSGLSQGVWLNFVNMLAAYCVSKGLSKTAIRPAAYEYMWQHIIESNTPTAASQDVLTKQALAEILRDSRAGDQQDAQNDWLKLTGGDVVGFSHLADPGTSIPASGSWGYYNNISDTTSEPGVSTVTWVAANT